MRFSRVIFGCCFAVDCLALAHVTAQVPDTPWYSIVAPPVGAQAGANLGCSVAVDGAYTVVGAPYDDVAEHDSGVAKVFDSTSGALLHVVANPRPGSRDGFGRWVAVSGSRFVVGADGDSTGAERAGSAYVYDLNSATPTVPVVILNNPTPDVYDGFGFSVGISGTRVVVGASGDGTGALYAGSAYVYNLSSDTPAVPVATLNNPSPASGDYFGISVAISGMRVVVGAARDDTGASNAGSAYVYDLGSLTPSVPVVTLNNPGPAVNDQFGVSVAISGTRVAVGAWGDDTGGTEAGSAYVYDLAGDTPSIPVATLNNPTPAPHDFFGFAVAISGSRVMVGADGFHTIATGVRSEGLAYAYDLESAIPTTPVMTLRNPSPSPGDAFGRSVAVSGTQMVVGAPYDDTGALDTGSAYGYDLNRNPQTLPVATFNNPGPSLKDRFGFSVGVSGTRVVVGAPYENLGAEDAGNASVYELQSGTPTVPAVSLRNPTPAAGDSFGQSVSLSGTRAVVGAPNDDTGAPDAGSVYVYDLGGTAPSIPVATLHHPEPAAYDHFGSSVSISGLRIAVGVADDDTSATDDAGTVCVYDLGGVTPTVPLIILRSPNPGAGDRFGHAVALFGTHVAVGAYLDDSAGAEDAGSVFVYDLMNETPGIPMRVLRSPSPRSGDGFGYAVAISEMQVAVGSPFTFVGADDAGRAYVYDLSGPAPAVPLVTLDNPSPAGDEHFGAAVAISGRHVVVGTPSDRTGAVDGGSAFVYDLASATRAVPVATLVHSAPAFGDSFGTAVAVDGTTVAIGAPFDDSVATDKGAVYIYGTPSAPADGDHDGLLDAWELTYWPATAGHSALDDFDHDGLTELLELAFGLNPTVPNAGGAPSVEQEGVFLTVTITKHEGVSYEVQSAGTLLPSLPDSFSATTTSVLVNSPTTLKVRDVVPLGASSARFIRVKVRAAP